MTGGIKRIVLGVTLAVGGLALAGCHHKTASVSSPAAATVNQGPSASGAASSTSTSGNTGSGNTSSESHGKKGSMANACGAPGGS